jgi:hypothetical protein
MKTIWQLHHVRELPDGCEDIKQIGLFASEDDARAAIEQVKPEPGFREYPNDFVLGEVVLGYVAFEQGFVTFRPGDDGRPGLDASGRSLLWYAAHEGDLQEVARLADIFPDTIDKADDLGDTPLRIAVACGNKEVVDQLISLGADVNSLDRHNDGPLWEAIRQACFSQASPRSIDVVKALLSAGANPDQVDAFGQSPRSVAQRNAVVAAIVASLGP